MDHKLGFLKLLLLATLLLVGLAGKARLYETQIEAERSVASGLALGFLFHESNNPGIAPTNIIQIFPSRDLKHLIILEDTFDPFGTNRGYANSILEKYVILQDKVTMEDTPGGEIKLISSQFFPDPEGQPNRTVVIQTKEHEYRGTIVSESKIQRMFKSAGTTIPSRSKTKSLQRPTKHDEPIDTALKGTLAAHPEWRGGPEGFVAKTNGGPESTTKQLGLSKPPKGNLENKTSSWVALVLLVFSSIALLMIFRSKKE